MGNSAEFIEVECYRTDFSRNLRVFPVNKRNIFTWQFPVYRNTKMYRKKLQLWTSSGSTRILPILSKCEKTQIEEMNKSIHVIQIKLKI